MKQIVLDITLHNQYSCYCIEWFVQYETTPLYLACEGGHSEVALLLIEKGADVDFSGSVSY